MPSISTASVAETLPFLVFPLPPRLRNCLSLSLHCLHDTPFRAALQVHRACRVLRRCETQPSTEHARHSQQ